MKRKTNILICVIFALILALPLFSCAKKTELSPEEIFEKSVVSTAEVISSGGQGTGFIVKVSGTRVYLLTAYHNFVSPSSSVFYETARLVFYDAAGRRKSNYDAKVTYYDSFHDLALLEFTAGESDSFSALEFSLDKMCKIGEKLYSAGNAAGDGLGFYDGIASKSEEAVILSSREGKIVPVFQTTVPINGGLSGAPVLDASGRIKGVAAYQRIDDDSRPSDRISYAIPGSIAEKFVTAAAGSEKKDSAAEIDKLSVKLNPAALSVKGFTYDFEHLRFTAVLKDGVLTVINGEGSDGVATAGKGLKEGDKIEKFGSLDISKAGFFDLFAESYNYVAEGAGDQLEIKYTDKEGRKQVAWFFKFTKRAV